MESLVGNWKLPFLKVWLLQQDRKTVVLGLPSMMQSKGSILDKGKRALYLKDKQAL